MNKLEDLFLIWNELERFEQKQNNLIGFRAIWSELEKNILIFYKNLKTVLY